MATASAARIPEGIKFEELARSLEVLANSNRLRLLHQLVEPRTTSEIKLQPESTREGENPERRISRQGVELHLRRLAAIGAIATTKELRGRSLVEVHTNNYPRLFALFEEFRALALRRPVRQQGPQPTIPGGGIRAPRKLAGPQLVIVRGLHEGTSFPLTPENRNAAGTWVIGRKRDLAVGLDYDPFVSRDNSELFRRRDAALAVRAMAGARNGTSLNWEPLEEGEERTLRHGDIIGVGRTLLLLRES